ncbi:MAG TPA: S8 family serine peptidase [Acidimicrobiales bacterium]
MHKSGRAGLAATLLACLLAATVALAAPGFATTAVVPGTTAAAPPASGAYVDPLLRDALANAAPADELVAIAAVGSVATPSTLDALRSTGVAAVGYRVLPFVAVRGTAAEIAALASLATVQSLWLDKPLEATLAQSTEQIQATDVWNPSGPFGFTGRGVGVAVLDSGIDGTHPDLHFPEHTIQNVKLLGYQKVFADLVFAQENVAVTDWTSGHGTHVAGIVAGDGTAGGGAYRGVAPGANLVGVGAAEGMDMLTALAGYDWVVANRDAYGIRVINNSWADGKMAYDERDPLVQASKRAVEAGITVVFAAGNDGQASGNTFNRYAWPSWVLSVGGVDKKGVLGTYSSRGDATHHADVVAPGTFIASARARLGPVSQVNATPFDLTEPTAPRMVPVEQWGDYTVKMGTSMAAPHVAGLVALVLEANPSLTPAQVEAIVVSTARRLPGCPVVDCGAGLVDAFSAVAAAVGARNAPPVAALAATPSSGAAPLDVTLDATGSSDHDGSVASYRWDIDGDGDTDATTDEPALAHTYGPGVHRPSVTVVDDRGLASVAASVEVRASQPPVASAAVAAKAKAGSAVTFDASASSDPDGSIASWTFEFGDGATMVSSSPVVTHSYAATRSTMYGWRVTVTDDAGVSDAIGGALKVTP